MARNLKQYLRFAEEAHCAAQKAAQAGDYGSAVIMSAEAQRRRQEARESADLVDLLQIESKPMGSR